MAIKISRILALLCILASQSVLAQSKSEMTQEDIQELSSAQLLGCNSLKNFKSFSVTHYSLSPSLRDKVNQEIAREFGEIGKIVNLDIPDVSGFGKSEASLSLVVKNISVFSDKKMPVVETTLFMNTATIIKKTDTTCMTHAWVASSFAEDKNEKQIISAVRTVLKQFVEDYKSANSSKAEKPVFYFYNQ